MAKKKNTLSSGHDDHISLIGISCHLKSYRLSFSINKALNFKLHRMCDFELPGNPSNEMLYFPFLSFNDDDLKNHFCLISNHHPQGKLIPALGQVDYFLIAKNPVDKYTREKILGKLRSISQVLAAYEIDPQSHRDIAMLLEDMEIHLMVSERNRHATRA